MMSNEAKTAEYHGHKFRGRCAMALAYNAKIAAELANAIRISPMAGCTDLGAIAACRQHMAQMSGWLEEAEESARAVAAVEAAQATEEANR